MSSPAFVGLLMLGELINVPFPIGLQLASQSISYGRTINSVCVIKILCVMHWDIPYFMNMKSLKRTYKANEKVEHCKVSYCFQSIIISLE